MLRHTLLVCLLLVLVACGGTPESENLAKLNGTWNSDLATYTFNTADMTMTRIALGQETSGPITVVRAAGNSLVLTSEGGSGKPLTATFQEDGKLLLGQEGAIPLVLTKAD